MFISASTLHFYYHSCIMREKYCRGGSGYAGKGPQLRDYRTRG